MNVSTDAIAEAFDACTTVMRTAVADGHLDTAMLAVANRDETLRAEGVGASNGAIAPRSDSIFLLASISKPIVATGILQLVERGAISLHEPVANHWPEFAVNHKETVTLWHLLTHTSGLDESYAERRRDVNESTVKELDSALVRETFLSFEPGSRYRYCNASFRVMTVLIERLTGQAYEDYLREQVLLPLGMCDTTFAPSAAQRDRVVPVRDVPFDLGRFVAMASPAGGYWSSTDDLIRFGQAYLRGGQIPGRRILHSRTVALATRIHYQGVDSVDRIQPSTVYRGLGFSIAGPLRSELVTPGTYGHGGATGTRLWIDPIHGLVVVFLTNRWGQDNRWRDRSINAFYGQLDVDDSE